MLREISADGYLDAALTVALFALTIVLHRRGTWRSGVDETLDAQDKHLGLHDRKFQALKDRHGLDTTIQD